MAPKDLWPFPGSRRTSGWTRARAVSWGRKQQVASNGKKLHDVGVFHDDWFRFWDPYINCLYSPHNWVGFHPLQQITRGQLVTEIKRGIEITDLSLLLILFFVIFGFSFSLILRDWRWQFLLFPPRPPFWCWWTIGDFLGGLQTRKFHQQKMVTQQLTTTQVTSLTNTKNATLASHVAIRFVKGCSGGEFVFGVFYLTPLKSNIDTQNDAMFEFGDTFSKPPFFGIYVRFRGGVFFHSSWIYDDGLPSLGRLAFHG